MIMQLAISKDGTIIGTYLNTVTISTQQESGADRFGVAVGPLHHPVCLAPFFSSNARGAVFQDGGDEIGNQRAT